MFCIYCRNPFDENTETVCSVCGRELFKENSNAPAQVEPLKIERKPPQAAMPRGAATGLIHTCTRCAVPFPVRCTNCGRQAADAVVPPEGWLPCAGCNQSYWVICPHCQNIQKQEQPQQEMPQQQQPGQVVRGSYGGLGRADEPYVAYTPNTPIQQETTPRTPSGSGGRKAPTDAQPKLPRANKPRSKAPWIAPLVLAPIIIAIIFLPPWERWFPPSDREPGYSQPSTVVQSPAENSTPPTTSNNPPPETSTPPSTDTPSAQPTPPPAQAGHSIDLANGVIMGSYRYAESSGDVAYILVFTAGNRVNVVYDGNSNYLQIMVKDLPCSYEIKFIETDGYADNSVYDYGKPYEGYIIEIIPDVEVSNRGVFEGTALGMILKKDAYVISSDGNSVILGEALFGDERFTRVFLPVD